MSSECTCCGASRTDSKTAATRRREGGARHVSEDFCAGVCAVRAGRHVWVCGSTLRCHVRSWCVAVVRVSSGTAPHRVPGACPPACAARAPLLRRRVAPCAACVLDNSAPTDRACVLRQLARIYWQQNSALRGRRRITSSDAARRGHPRLLRPAHAPARAARPPLAAGPPRGARRGQGGARSCAHQEDPAAHVHRLVHAARRGTPRYSTHQYSRAHGHARKHTHTDMDVLEHMRIRTH